MTTNDLITKAWRIINGCQTAQQAKIALRWIDRMELADSNIDTSAMRKELNVLFNSVYFG